jgi:hypothetical protein
LTFAVNYHQPPEVDHVVPNQVHGSDERIELCSTFFVRNTSVERIECEYVNLGTVSRDILPRLNRSRC